MNILHFKYAVEIAKTNSISKAAENLFMGQPTLSRAIKELEEELGITIFNRTSKGISLTPDGTEFLQYARQIITQVEEIEQIYKYNKTKKQKFSVCVPRSSYISGAMATFVNKIPIEHPIEIFYKETNSTRTITNVLNEEYKLGIIRYQTSLEKYFNNLLIEKKLKAKVICEFRYVILVSKNSELAKKGNLQKEDLGKYMEVYHGDQFVPSLSIVESRNAELSEHINKRIFVFDRASQLQLIEKSPNVFMWAAPMPNSILDKYNLVQINTADEKIYKDVLIYRNDYKLTKLDESFINEVKAVKIAF